MADPINMILPGMLAGLGVFMGLIAIAFYVYTALAWMSIAKKLNHPHPWLAWIPIANGAMILQLGGFHWAWIFLVLIPILGWIAIFIMAIIATWRIYEQRNYPGWLALVPLLGFVPFVNWVASIANLVIIGLVAWMDR
jgi:hypothetical protein|tara:strand:- start:17 stop:430 length:414 start_codon:yes stop_codon:yes gene_type:complete